jgi:hypothetical protein
VSKPGTKRRRGQGRLCVVVLCLAVSMVAAGPAGADEPARRPHGRRDAANMPTSLSRTNTLHPAAAQPQAAPPAGVPAAPMSPEAMHLPRDFNSCRKLPGKRLVRVPLKPDADLGDLIAWISSVTCKQFLVPGSIPANSKKVTIIAPQALTVDDAYQLFLGALNSVDLTVEPNGRFLRVIETSRAKSAVISFEGAAETPAADPFVTRLVRVEHTNAKEAATLLAPLEGTDGEVEVATEASLIITDRASNVSRMLALLRRIDRPQPGGRRDQGDSPTP